MGHGPGRYGKETQEALISARAHTVLLLVLGGNAGDGFSFASTGGPEVLVRVPGMLEQIARGIRADLAKTGQ